MKRLDSKKSLAALALAGALMTGSVAYAQDPAAPAADPAAAAPAPDGTVTNQTTTDTTIVQETAPIGAFEETTVSTTTEVLPDTGGEPVLFALGGLLLAGGSLLLRRKVSAN
jgi:LPXTG-motif cell wall-anchored protein